MFRDRQLQPDRDCRTAAVAGNTDFNTMSSNGLNFGGSAESNTEQQRTNIELENPSHPDNSINYADSPEDAEEYFQAAVAAKNWPEPREKVVGECLVAIREAFEGGDPQGMLDLVEDITGEEVELADSDE